MKEQYESEVINKAKSYAIESHRGQVRKSEKDKPMVIHPINSSNILKEYGFDENVVAAALLHDVVEDTSKTIEDIRKEFGSDIASLVESATEPDKSKSWEERKQYTIDLIKNLDLRHKAVVCADKISNLEDLKILFEIKQSYDFSLFRRGFEKQKWYYESVYNSLIHNEDKDSAYFVRLKELIDYIFYGINDDEFVKKVLFEYKEDEYNKLKVINYKVKEIKKMISVLNKKLPYVIEFTGTPRTGKTSLINNIKDLFIKEGLKTSILEEFTTSEKYKKEIYPTIKHESKKSINEKIPKFVEDQLDQELEKDIDVILVDRSLLDRLIWIDKLYQSNGLTLEEYNGYKEKYFPIINDKIDIIIGTYTDSITSLKRDYSCYLSLAKRNFLNVENVDNYNNSLLKILEAAKNNNVNMFVFDTTLKTEKENAISVINIILDDMRKKYLNELVKIYK